MGVLRDQKAIDQCQYMGSTICVDAFYTPEKRDAEKNCLFLYYITKIYAT